MTVADNLTMLLLSPLQMFQSRQNDRKWERDEEVKVCRTCNRKFSMNNRRVSCAFLSSMFIMLHFFYSSIASLQELWVSVTLYVVIIACYQLIGYFACCHLIGYFCCLERKFYKVHQGLRELNYYHIMQIVRGGKVLRFHDLLVIRRITFAIVQQFKTPYNKKEKIYWKTFAIGG